MIARYNVWLVLAAVGLALPGTAFAASDVSNSGQTSRQAVTAVVSPVVSQQTSSIISSAISSGLSGIGGGFAPQGGVGGGFVPQGGGSGGGFAPQGGGSGGGFAPQSGGSNGPQSSLPFTSTRGMAGGGAASKFGVWTQGTYSYVDRSESGLEMSGDVYNLVAGADYKATDKILLGVAVSGEYANIDTSYNNGTFKGSGVSVAPYIGVTLSPNWSADVSGGYGWLSYDVDRNNDAISGSYNARRTFVTGTVTGAYAHQSWRFQPKASVSYTHEFQDAYTEKGGSRIDSDTTEFGRFSAGSKIGYAIGNGVPYLKLMGEWDFLKPDAVIKANGQESYSSNGGGVIGLGYEIYRGGFIGSAEVNYNSLFRENLDLYTVALRARYEF